MGTRGIQDRCSPASTGTRWTRRDGLPSPRSSEPSSTAERSSPAGSTPALPSRPARSGSASRRRSPPSRPWKTRVPGSSAGSCSPTPSRSSGTPRAVRAPGLPPRGGRAGRRGRHRRVARPRGDLDAGRLGRLPPGARRPRRAGAALLGAWASSGISCAPRIRSGSARRRWRRHGGRAPPGARGARSSRCSPRDPAASTSIAPPVAVGTPSGSWRPPARTGACWRSMPTPPRSRGCGSGSRGSATGSSCGRPTSGISARSRPPPASAPSTASCWTSA